MLHALGTCCFFVVSSLLFILWCCLGEGVGKACRSDWPMLCEPPFLPLSTIRFPPISNTAAKSMARWPSVICSLKCTLRCVQSTIGRDQTKELSLFSIATMYRRLQTERNYEERRSTAKKSIEKGCHEAKQATRSVSFILEIYRSTRNTQCILR